MDNQNELKTICMNIRYLRKKHKYSQKTMAALLHTGVNSIRKMEQGIFPERLGVSFVISVYRVFGVLPQALVGTVLEETDSSSLRSSE